jgi:hypothetical protein
MSRSCGNITQSIGDISVTFFIPKPDLRGVIIFEHGFKTIEAALVRILTLAEFYKAPLYKVVLNKSIMSLADIEATLLKGKAKKREITSIKKLCEKALERIPA